MHKLVTEDSENPCLMADTTDIFVGLLFIHFVVFSAWHSLLYIDFFLNLRTTPP